SRASSTLMSLMVMSPHGVVGGCAYYAREIRWLATLIQNHLNSYIEKPFNHQQLIDCIQQALALNQHQRLAQRRHDELVARFAELRPKEQQILRHVAEGMTSREIAEHLDISAKTVEVYRLRTMRALGAENLAELVRMAVALGLVEVMPKEKGEE
ncbi:response regulator transcription factor, partial [Halomonas sp. IOP_31]|uniref:response regulator transcription factor n=1 Tax=Halomonas sp. IOP_31 TaxID=2876584 RepID=UPI001E62C2A0